MKGKILFAVVSNDEFELPFIIGTLDDCADYTGLSSSTINTAISKHKTHPERKWSGTMKWVRFTEGEDDDDN